jgi:uncharacterized protein
LAVINRKEHVSEIEKLLQQFPVVALLGARQIGKSTLASLVAKRTQSPVTHFDLEDPRAVARLAEPMLALSPLKGLVILDEVQRRPDLFPALRVLADRPRTPARFLVLGSASPALLRQTSESLAGRIAYHHLSGLDLSEVTARGLDRLWIRGGFPRSFLARTDGEGAKWCGELVRTFVERDLPDLSSRMTPETTARFWQMLAHYHAQVWNAAELARAFGVSEKTVRQYLDVLVGAFVVRRLSPWHENLKKRQIKAPKVYISDTGLLHALLKLRDRDDVLGHPKAGASWEGFCIAQIARRLRAAPDECFFWGVHTGAKLDLLVVRGRSRLGFEVKLTDAPRVTRSMHSALQDLKLDRLDVVHAGRDTFALSDRIRAVSMHRLGADVG